MEKNFIDSVEYKSNSYPCMSTTIVIDGIEESFVIATERLWNDILEDCLNDDDDALRLDNEIFFYMDEEEFNSLESVDDLNDWILTFLDEK